LKRKKCGEVVKMYNAERGENVTLGCCTTAGVCIPPTIIFKGLSILGSHKQNVLAGSTVQMTQTSYINETVILKWFAAFQKTPHSWQIPVYI
jgi:hypothetical protein